MLHYRTHAQPIVVHQTRIPGPKPEVKHTTSHEEPQRVVHEVIRPIIQEVHEIIQPYRRVVQQVQPVIEEVRTIIAKDANSGDGSAKASLPVANHLASSNAGNDHRSLMSGHNHHSLLVNAGSGHGYGHSSGVGSYNGGPNKGPLYASASVSDLRHVASKPSSSTSSSNLNNAFDRKSMLENENLLSLPNNQRLVRSKVYITRKGVPVYQSNYRAPVYFTI
ncbi:hypothetical protein NH340_JMT02081 [Sarcoptes scabiei]|nr:hypothetical protein NH340_JMT02081 [Sarcoptes scabiei]